MRLRWFPVLFWVGITGYVALTVLVAAGVLDSLDRSVYDFCLRHRDPTLASAAEHFITVFSPIADVGILAYAMGMLAWRRHRSAVFVPAAATVAVMAAVVLVTKHTMDRPLPGIRHDRPATGFPSGHTASFLVCFGTLVLLTTRRTPAWRPALLAAVGAGTVLIAAALVYVGGHWLTDTVASVSLGVGLLSALSRTVSPRSGADTPPTGRTALPR